jgi:hypothetical protein
MRHSVRRSRWEWEHISANGQVVSWIHHGVWVKFKNGLRLKPFNHYISPRYTAPTQLPRNKTITIRGPPSVRAPLEHPLRPPHVPRP